MRRILEAMAEAERCIVWVSLALGVLGGLIALVAVYLIVYTTM